MTWIQNNYEWMFSGVGVVLVVFVVNWIRQKKTRKPVSILNSQNSDKNLIEDDLRNKKASILFIDDKHLDFKMVSILKKSGWRNTRSIKDLTDLDDPKVLDADIIFVDINGVGKQLFEDQGLGLASALKKRYGNKKIIIYSAETAGDRFHKALREVDDCLPKNAEPYQFINLVENFTEAK